MILMLPIMTAQSIIKPALEWLASALCDNAYGEVGVMFTLHDSRIVGVEQIERRKYKA